MDSKVRTWLLTTFCLRIFSSEIIVEFSSSNNSTSALRLSQIEENSPSRRDIELERENYLRKSYTKLLFELGNELTLPRYTIATAIIFCHRFFLRHSHAKYDRRTIAIACMFLAGKAEDTPRCMKDVLTVSHRLIYKNEQSKALKIKQKEEYEKNKDLIVSTELLVLQTLGFDMDIVHPYKLIEEAMKKFEVCGGTLAQEACAIVNDGLYTSMCLQFEPHQIAAGATFVAAKRLKVKLPSAWWEEFDITPNQLEEVSSQMVEMVEQNHARNLSNNDLTGGQSPQNTTKKLDTEKLAAFEKRSRLQDHGSGSCKQNQPEDRSGSG